MYKNGSVKLL